MLDLAAVMTLAQACAPDVAPQTLSAIAYAESRFDPLAIGVNDGPRPQHRPRNDAEAARLARSLIARGANLDLGLAQINSGNLAWLGLSVEAAFDPCRNLKAAATVLRAGYQPAGPAEHQQQTALRTALSRYNTGHPHRGVRNGYVARVEAAAVRLGVATAAWPQSPALPIAPANPDPAPSAPPPAWDVFARARVSAVLAFAPSESNWSSVP